MYDSCSSGSLAPNELRRFPELNWSGCDPPYGDAESGSGLDAQTLDVMVANRSQSGMDVDEIGYWNDSCGSHVRSDRDDCT